ncbi:MAG: alpha/beta fold hydrolase [Bryobacteraceae bacterium]
MPYAFNKGTKLYWEEHGRGTPILLIMGLSFTHEMWFRVLPWLGDRYRLILFDNRGMGLSDCPKGPYSIRQMAADAGAVLDAAGVPAAHVVGASMGGMIAQEFVFQHPDRVLSLVLACSTYSGMFGKWPHFNRRPRGIRWAKATRMERENALAALLYAESTPRERLQEDFEVRCQCRWSYRGFLNQLAGVLVWNSYRRLPRTKVPTLVLHGDEDHLIPPENGKVLASRIPGAQFHLLPKAGHILITDQPEACRDIILQFLETVTMPICL